MLLRPVLGRLGGGRARDSEEAAVWLRKCNLSRWTTLRAQLSPLSPK